MADPAGGSHRARSEDARHAWRIFAIWFLLSAVIDPLYYFLAGPHMPPGAETSAASGAQFDLNVVMVTAMPVVIAVVLYLGYAVVVWGAKRSGDREAVGGPKYTRNLRVQMAFIGVTTLIVMGMFVFGTVELIVPAGAGGGEGPNPIWTPTSKTILPIQVIAQQWKFTYRYPTFGGFETDQLMLPDNTTVAFHVTSLDVIHSFWAYQLGVKADANPAEDNVAYTTTQQTGEFTVRCSELCGLWHGSMYDFGHIMTKQGFEQWATSTEQKLAPATKLLPKFAYTYVPDANGADGGYYPDNVDPYSNVETYGASTTQS
jgi:cytochrome c oxidase subunit 2